MRNSRARTEPSRRGQGTHGPASTSVIHRSFGCAAERPGSSCRSAAAWRTAPGGRAPRRYRPAARASAPAARPCATPAATGRWCPASRCATTRPGARAPGQRSAGPVPPFPGGELVPGRLGDHRPPVQRGLLVPRTPPQLRGASPEPADPAAGGRIWHPRPFRGRADPARAAGHLRDHHAYGLGRIQPPGQRERRQRMARPARRAPQPGHEDLPAAARLPDITPVPRPEHQRPGTRRAGRDEGTRRHGQLPDRHRPQAGTAIRWPRATPPRIPSRDRRKTRRGGIPHIQRGHGGDVAAER